MIRTTTFIYVLNYFPKITYIKNFMTNVINNVGHTGMECIVAFSFEGNRTARFNVYGWILSLETNRRTFQ